MSESVKVSVLKTTSDDDREAVANFVAYLRIPSVHPDIDYGPCIDFLKEQAKSLGLPIQVYTVVPKKPIAVITWEGTEPALPSILLNSHMDVVPVFPDKWKYDPFGAEKDAKGNIYARGTQDMKSVGIQYLEAVRRLRKNGIKLRRTVHVSFVPDEEIGGNDGMAKFVQTIDFRNLNVGFALDEGMANPENDLVVFYGERAIWQVHVHCPGSPGHGSLILPDTAGEKLRIIIDKFMDFRQKEKEKFEANPKLHLGDVTTVNLTMIQIKLAAESGPTIGVGTLGAPIHLVSKMDLCCVACRTQSYLGIFPKGGKQANVVPPELNACFDIRIAPTVDHVEFETMLWKWAKEAGPGVTLTFVQKSQKIENTKLDESNRFWMAFKKEAEAMGLQLEPAIFPAATDSRYIRQVGLPALGFSPINNTPILLHDHDEFLNESVFLRGIAIYCNLIPAVANLPCQN